MKGFAPHALEKPFRLYKKKKGKRSTRASVQTGWLLFVLIPNARNTTIRNAAALVGLVGEAFK